VRLVGFGVGGEGCGGWLVRDRLNMMFRVKNIDSVITQYSVWKIGEICI
jgi:hypothetical protein